MTTPALALNVPITTEGSLCGNANDAQKLADDLAQRYPKATMVNGLSLPAIRAAIALQRNQPDQALAALRPAAPYEAASSFWTNYLRGEAYLRLGKGTEAAAEFRTILEHRGWQPLSVFYPLARLGLARASVLAGDTAAARGAYQDFFAMWKDADPDLPVLAAAKQEHGALK